MIKHYAEDVGLNYISARTKDEFLNQLPGFLKTGKSIVFELFTKAEEEEFTFRTLRSLLGVPAQKKKSLKSIIKGAVGSERIQAAKTILGL